MLLATMALAGASADAHIKRIASRVRHTSTAIEGDVVTKLGGVVRSKRDKCVPGRKVSVYVGGDRFGSATTNASGAWVVEGEGEAGRRYRFTVHPAKLSSPKGHSHTCGAHTLYKDIE